MFRKSVVLACLVLVAAAFAETGAIRGQVFSAQTRQPIQGALVRATGPSGEGQFTTYPCGTYIIANLPVGKYQVKASASGYECAVYPESIHVTPGDTICGIDFYLEPAGQERGAIAGRVYDAETRLPIQGALAKATGPAGSGQAETYPCGSYFITSLPNGKYQVQASAAGYECAVYPESVQTVPGETVLGIDFYLTRAQQNHGGIKGMVKNRASGQVIQGAAVKAAGREITREVVQTCQGYQINELPPGKYWVSATATGFQPGAYPESVTVVAGQVTPEITFCLEPCGGELGGIQGQVKDASSGQVIPRAVVRSTDGRIVREVMQTCQGYKFLELPPGKYWVSAKAEGYQDGHYPDSVTVVAGQITYEIIFCLEPRQSETGKLTGIVLNAETEEPVMGALVVAAGPSQGRANTCRLGRFAIPNLLPGRYVVEVAARGYEPYREDGIVIEAGRVTDIRVLLTPQSCPNPGAIAGMVRDSATNAPIEGARVLAWGRQVEKFGVTDPDGHYLISELPPGPYVVRACAQGYLPQLYPDTVVVPEGQTVDGVCFLLVHCRPGDAGIAGFVLDGNTQLEIPGALVKAIGEGGAWTQETNSSGDYLFDNLPPGEYLLETSAPDYTTELSYEPVLVIADQITSFVSPAVYPLTGIVENPAPTGPHGLLLSVGPNPASGPCVVRWQVGRAGGTAVQVLDNAGRVVRTLSRGYQAQGDYATTWDRTDDHGSKVTNGIYFLRLVTEGREAVTKAVLLSE